VAWAVFMLVWNSRRFVRNDAYVFLGIAVFVVGLIDVIHTLTFKGMGVFPELKSANIPTQLWIASRYIESLSLLSFVFLFGKTLDLKTIFWSYAGLTLLILASIFVWPVFPDCFIEGSGLTPFKKNSEYLFCLILAAAGILVRRKQSFFDADVQRLLFSAILVTIGAELCFTQYVSVYGSANLIGHFLKIISFYLIYLALIRYGLSRPFTILFGKLNHARERYRLQALKYANILETTADGFWMVDSTGKIMHVNDAIAGMLGYSKEDLRGKTVSDIEVLETAEDIQKRMAGVQQNNYGHFETMHRRADGTLIDVEISAVYLDQDGGQFAAFIRNITQRKHAENELRLSEHKFSMAYNSTPLLMGISSVEDGTYLDVNDTFIRISGYTREEIIGRRSVDLGLISMEDRLRFFRILTEEGRVNAMELILTTKSREKRVCQFWAELIEIQGQFRILAMVHDITEQRRLFDELAQERAVLKAVFESTPDMFVLKDAAGVYRSVNTAFCRFVGKTAAEIIGRTDFDIFPYEDAEVYAQKDRNVLRTGISEVGDWAVMGADGRIWLQVAKTAVIGSGGQIDGVLCSVHEITDRKKMENLMQARLRLSETDVSQYSEVDLMRKTLDETERLTDSQIGFFHFVHEDTGMIILKTWSTRTVQEFCRIESFEASYPIEKAGVWMQFFHERRPVIHNDYAALPDRKGLPNGHSPIVRELIVPVFRGDQIVAVLGVGNKPVDYTDQDVRMVSAMADLAWDILTRNRAMTALKDSEDKHRRLAYTLGQAADAIMITDTAGAIQYVNPAFETVTGYPSCEIIGENPRIMKSGEHDREFYRALWQILLAGEVWSGRIINRRKDGALVTVEGTISPVVESAGGGVGYVAVMRNITEQLKLEDKIRQAQKMEAIGTLAGGIAHDFNNILFPLVGFAEMIRDELPADSSLQPCVDGVLKAAIRATELVKQILSFSRQTEQDKTVVRVQIIVKEVLKLIRAGLPSNIRIEPSIGNTCPPVLADATQLYQVTMNLITNAYHAMETTGGVLGVSLKTVLVEAGEETDIHLVPGTYICLSVSDTGPGIDAFILDRIFEPYFTTKPEGKGTGLGLSISHAIVQSCGGDILVDSRVGQGTTFRVYLPSAIEGEAMPVPEIQEDIRGGNEHILVVDDEEPILYMLTLMLKKLGYQVTVSLSSTEALDMFRADPHRFQLVVTDLTMPHITGDRLSAALKKIDPDIPVILCTGFSERIMPENIQSIGIDGFVKKPILKREIAVLIRNILDN
jgi:PAS domain S-box-containing protein